MGRWRARLQVPMLGLLLVCLFLSQLMCAALLHLDTQVARRSIARSVSAYLSAELRGTFDVGSIDTLSTSRVVLRNVVVYDEQQRRVATFSRLRADSSMFGALFRWLTRREALTLILESVRADGVHLRMHPSGIEATPSLLVAFEPNPVKVADTTPSQPYRVFLANVELGDVSVDSTLPSFVTNSLRLRRLAGHLLFTHQGIAASLKRFSLDLQDPITVPLHAFGTLEYRSPDRLWGDVNVTLGTIPCSMHLDYQKRVLKLGVQPFKIDPTAARQWFSDWPLQVPLTASLSANGPFEDLGLRVRLHAATSEVEGFGRLALGSAVRADLAVIARSLDLEGLFGAPIPSDLDAAVRLSVKVEESQPRMHFEGLIEQGHLAGFATPRIDLEGQFDSEGLTLSGRSNDSRLPIRAAAVLRDQELNIDAQIDNAQLEQLVSEAGGLGSRGSVSARTRTKIKGDAISSQVDVTLRDLQAGSISVGMAALSAEFEGALESPKTWTGTLNINARRVGAAPYVRFDRLAAIVTGNAQSAHLTLNAEQPKVAEVAFDSDVRPLDGPSFASSRLELTRANRTLSLRAKTISISDETILLDGLAIDGSAGKVNGTLGIQPEHVFGKLDGSSLKLGVLAELFGLPPNLLSGTADFAIEVDTRQRPVMGHARFEFDRAYVGSLTNVSGNLELGLADRQLNVTSALASDLVGEVRTNIDVVLAGPPNRIRSYRHATGNATLDVAQLRLDRAASTLGLLGEEATVTGTVDLRLSAERTTESEQPNWTLSAVTNQLAAAASKTPGTPQLKGFELLLGAGFRGDTGTLTSDLVLYRGSQPKATLTVTAAMPPIDRWLGDALTPALDWRELPFESFLALQRQSIGELGDVIGLRLGSGEFEAKVSAKGPARDAHIVAQLQGKNLLLTSLGNTTPFEVEGLVEHGQAQTRVLLAAGSQQATWMQLNAVGTLVPCPNRLGCFSEWNGQLEMGLLGLPIGALPYVAKLGITGEVRGVLSARRNAGRSSIDGVLPVDNLRLSGQALGQALLHVRSTDDSLVAGTKLIDGGAQLDVEAHFPIEWRTLLPGQRKGAPLRMVASATGYDAAIASPWLREYVTDLGGELSGRLDATYGTIEGDDETVSPQLAIGGYLTLNRGKGVLRALGLAFSDVAIAAQASSTGQRTTISVPTISASTGGGQNNLSGSAVAELEALSLKRVTARLGHAKEVPLVLNSVTFATLTGAANVELTPKQAGFDVNIDFDDLDIRLPRTTSRKVVGLTDNPDIVVQQPLGPEAWRKAKSVTPAEYRVRLSLGTRARVTRSDLALPITGTPEFVVGTRFRPSGSVQLGSLGRLQLFGKSFAIERGLVTLDPDHPSNPQLDVTATWRGPTHVVTVQVQGTLEDARLRLTSDPALASEAQVMALLLGGGSANDSTAGAGLGVGATLFNELLSDTALSSLEVRTSSGERHANYTAAVPIRENLWFEATYQSPTNTSLAGSSAQRGFSGTVDYRFRKNWSVRTEVGTLGAGADLMWQYRY